MPSVKFTAPRNGYVIFGPQYYSVIPVSLSLSHVKLSGKKIIEFLAWLLFSEKISIYIFHNYVQLKNRRSLSLSIPMSESTVKSLSQVLGGSQSPTVSINNHYFSISDLPVLPKPQNPYPHSSLHMENIKLSWTSGHGCEDQLQLVWGFLSSLIFKASFRFRKGSPWVIWNII